MKNYVRISTVLALSLALTPAQAYFADPVFAQSATVKTTDLSKTNPKKTASADETAPAAATDPSKENHSETTADPSQIPIRFSPISTNQAIRSQIQAAAQWIQSQLQSESESTAAQPESDAEVIPSKTPSETAADTMKTETLQPETAADSVQSETTADAMQSETAADTMQSETAADTVQSEPQSEPADPKLLEEKRRRQEKQLKHLRNLLSAQQNALNIALTERDTPAYVIDPELIGTEELYPSLFEEEETETETETEPVKETETETETELPEETETEFHPVKMGASIPDAGTLANDSETEALEDNSSETEDVSSDSGENGEEESETENAASGLVSRHGVFEVPAIEGLNEARINLYDYRMLREYPLSRLPMDLHLLQTQLETQIAEYEGTWSVFVQNLTTGQIMILNDTPLRSASVMKLFIMGTLYEAFDRGEVERNEETVTLLRSMIINSSNDASNRLLTILGNGDLSAGVARVNEFIQLRGYSSGTVEYNGFQDSSAIVDPNHANIIAAKDVGLLLNRVYSRSFISRKVCNEIEQMMLDQATRYKIPRGLPEGVQCGNKSGETDSIANDAAVIYGPTTDYILVVLSNDWSNENTANEQVEAVSRTVYHFFEG